MRILLVIDTLDVGGAERHTVNLAIALRHRGHWVAVACAAPTGSFGERHLGQDLSAAGISVYQLLRRPVKRRISLRYAWTLRRLLKHAPVDVVHAHCFASAAAAALATWRTDIPLVLTEHSEAIWQSRAARQVSRCCHRRARGSIAVSASIASQFTSHRTGDQLAMTVIHNAIPPPIESALARQNRRRQAHGPSSEPGDANESDCPLVGVIARLQREKGVHVFLAALSHLPQIQGLILGDGPERLSLEQHACRLGIAARVCFLPGIIRADDTLRRLDILAVPSLTEGSPLVVLEAMTAGIPLVASRVGGISELIVHHEHGILVPAGDAAALAAGISSLLADDRLAQRLTVAAQARVLACFPFHAMVTATEQVYHRALERVEA